MPRVGGKRISKNVYAKTREECEEKLAELIKTMKAEIAAQKRRKQHNKRGLTIGQPSVFCGAVGKENKKE